MVKRTRLNVMFIRTLPAMFYAPTDVNVKKLHFITQCIYMFRIVLKRRHAVSLQRINRLVFIMNRDCVLREVEIQFSCITCFWQNEEL
jgi:hypothetical protein